MGRKEEEKVTVNRRGETDLACFAECRSCFLTPSHICTYVPVTPYHFPLISALIPRFLPRKPFSLYNDGVAKSLKPSSFMRGKKRQLGGITLSSSGWLSIRRPGSEDGISSAHTEMGRGVRDTNRSKNA